MIRTAAPWLDQASTVFVNAAEYRLLTTLTDMAALPEVVVSDGPRTARVWTFGRQTASVVPPSRPPCEVSGAGDTVTGTFLAHRSRGATAAQATGYQRVFSTLADYTKVITLDTTGHGLPSAG